MSIEETIQRELSCAMQAERFLYPRDHSLLHASAIGQCRRQQGYELMGIPGLPQDSHFLSICDIGHGVHHQLQNRLVDVLKWVKRENIELEVKNEEYGIVGHIDALSEPLQFDGERFWSPNAWDAISFGVPYHQYVIDIKTITSRPYLKVNPETAVLQYAEPSSFEKLQAIKKEHLLQVNLYAWMLKEMGLVEEYPRLMVIYIAKDTDHSGYEDGPDRLLSLPYKVFVRDAEQEQIDGALKRAKHIWSRVRKGELAGKDYWYKPESPDWHCACCSFRKECYKEEGYFQNEVALISPASLSIVESYRG